MFPITPYLLLPLNPPPVGVGGRSLQWKDYNYSYSGDDINVLEINYLQEGSVTVLHEDGPVTYPQGSVRVFRHDTAGAVSSPDPILHEVYLTMRIVRPPVPMTESEVAAWQNTVHYAILPHRVEDPAVCEKVGILLKRAAQTMRERETIAMSLRVRTCLYEILTLLTEYSVSTARRKLKDHRIKSRHTQSACRYIRGHLGEKFTVAQVAEAVGVSYNHLKAVFQQDMNMSLVEYANRERIRRVEHLVLAEEMNLEAAGAAVGIHDPKYLSRLFRRYTGMTCSEYRRMHPQ